MAQPTPYSRQSDFTDHSGTYPTTPHSGVALDAEFNALANTLAAVLVNLALIQRDDGALKNSSVGTDQLNAAVLAMINAASGMSASAWAAATSYVAGQSWVSQGTGSYVCATSHTSGVFADDLAAGRWVQIFDSAGTEPADGSVTTAKLADASVTLAKLAITALDLSGAVRGQGGVAAGTAALGELLAARAAAGDVIAKFDRTTKAQGVVGVKVGGGIGGVDWHLRQVADSDAIELWDGTAVRARWAGGMMDVTRLRATGYAVPSGGAGVNVYYYLNHGYVESYSHDLSAWRPLTVGASTFSITCGGIEVAAATSLGINFPVNAQIGGIDAGYRDVPQNVQSAAYTLALTDRGKHIYSENVGAQTLTIPANASVAFPLGTAVSVVNRGANPITVSAASVTLRQAGTTNTGNRTIAVNGLATLLKVGTDTWFISGAGVS